MLTRRMWAKVRVEVPLPSLFIIFFSYIYFNIASHFWFCDFPVWRYADRRIFWNFINRDISSKAFTMIHLSYTTKANRVYLIKNNSVPMYIFIYVWKESALIFNFILDVNPTSKVGEDLNLKGLKVEGGLSKTFSGRWHMAGGGYARANTHPLNFFLTSGT